MNARDEFNDPVRREQYRRALTDRDRGRLDELSRRRDTLMAFAIGTHNRLRHKKIAKETKRLQSRAAPGMHPQGGPLREARTAQAIQAEAARNVDHQHDMRLKRIAVAAERLEARYLAKGRAIVGERRFGKASSLGRTTSFSKSLDRGRGL